MDLFTALGILRRRWMIFVLCVAAGVGGGYALAHHTQKQYAATAQVLVNVPVSDNLEQQLQGTQLSSNLVTTYANLVASEVVRRDVMDQLQALGERHQAGTLSGAQVPATYLINIKSTSPYPEVAQLTANYGAAALISTVASLQVDQPQPVRIKVVGPATYPGAPYAPRPAFDIFVGALLGLVVGLALIAMLEALDRTVHSVQQADALLKAPLLGVVPKHKRRTVVVGRKNEGAEGEPYRSLRTAIRFVDLDRPIHTMLVTSPTENDGKTSTAANLAIVLAMSGERVILVDADLRRAGLGKALGIDSSVGLTNLVLGGVALQDTLQNYRQNLLVLASGPLPPNPSEILGSQLVNDVLHELANLADIIIIDAPPVLPVADAVALSTQVDATLVVLRHGTTLRSGAAATRRRLDAVGARVVGYVLNAVPRRETRDYYTDNRDRYYSTRHQAEPSIPV
ncbi:MAG TPA: polysaccharide biosynthesis tyrosine autokinase [Mycobacteriales bacterium]|nr:polysaccharide biosynthesis tyrosine autokinase [Mycobacteriales bacterium]